ncbi:uncharacterized protein BXIN_2433 [Babesia sp. Xinjiang]|uniref:uncharacterized protein n=1 Tax=Babesia sp. Xinjiang TaxID=462227 RepID=UPI000A22CDDE|nr:uncharacterized protein BXIN_2433 [Babesia sp. Xinjiang]ORM41461.1 hypothetical protein BXIN_2433 [Babesia sp. Xinjiang]
MGNSIAYYRSIVNLHSNFGTTCDTNRVECVTYAELPDVGGKNAPEINTSRRSCKPSTSECNPLVREAGFKLSRFLIAFLAFVQIVAGNGVEAEVDIAPEDPKPVSLRVAPGSCPFNGGSEPSGEVEGGKVEVPESVEESVEQVVEEVKEEVKDSAQPIVKEVGGVTTFTFPDGTVTMHSMPLKKIYEMYRQNVPTVPPHDTASCPYLKPNKDVPITIGGVNKSRTHAERLFDKEDRDANMELAKERFQKIVYRITNADVNHDRLKPYVKMIRGLGNRDELELPEDLAERLGGTTCVILPDNIEENLAWRIARYLAQVLVDESYGHLPKTTFGELERRRHRERIVLYIMQTLKAPFWRRYY